jgi:hypothetical protein
MMGSLAPCLLFHIIVIIHPTSQPCFVPSLPPYPLSPSLTPHPSLSLPSLAAFLSSSSISTSLSPSSLHIFQTPSAFPTVQPAFFLNSNFPSFPTLLTFSSLILLPSPSLALYALHIFLGTFAVIANRYIP